MGKTALFGQRCVRRPNNMLTLRQAEVLEYMWSFYERNDQLPPCEAIRDHFGFASANSAAEHIRALELKGWLERNELGHKYRFTSLTREAMARPAVLAA